MHHDESRNQGQWHTKNQLFPALATFLGIWDGVEGKVKMKFWSNMFRVEIFSGRMKWAGEGFS